MAKPIPSPPVVERPTFLIHGLDQAIVACRAAVEADRPIALLSMPNCAQSAGVGWFIAVVDQARAACPDVDAIAILDCDDATGRALQAMAAGMRHLIVNAGCPALDRLCDIAAQCGVTILTRAPTHIDLGACADPETASAEALDNAETR